MELYSVPSAVGPMFPAAVAAGIGVSRIGTAAVVGQPIYAEGGAHREMLVPP